MELKTLFRDIADAIRQKDGTTDPIIASDFPGRIRTLPSVPVKATPKDVNFYDYDGALVYSYTLAEAQALTILPDGPKHDGLVFQGWNWSLEKVKALTRPMNVGAMYITDDGKTRLKIRVWDIARSNAPLYISQTVANGVTIDWGDGSSVETLDGTGNVNTTHQYAETGDYTIALAVADGCELGLGIGNSSYCIMGSTVNNGRAYCNLLQEVNIGGGTVKIGASAFRACASISSISVPYGIISIDNEAFRSCYSLASITIPGSVASVGNGAFITCSSLAIVTIADSVTRMGQNAFNSCYSMRNVTIPDGVTYLGDSIFGFCYALASATISHGIANIRNGAFELCNALASITIPGSVASIGNGAFRNCYAMAEYHLKPTTPPTLTNINAFEGIPSDCIIYVPVGSLEAYKTAENWSTYADYMREEPSK